MSSSASILPAPLIIVETDGDKCGQALAELIEYFAGRMISAETLQKNAMMQMIDDKNVIAFTYRRNGELVNCNFYSITSKNFWQAKNGERILYGLDGIEEGNDIVIESRFKYLLDCNGVKNASRIILAIHDNRPGPALAELSSVLGKKDVGV
nr:hypothetical protein [Tanacetum cinerariifolium]